MNDPYSVLGVSRDATKEEIKNAHRRLAKKYHPDICTEPDAAAKMAEINAALDAINNPPSSSGGYHGADPFDIFRANGFNFEDIFHGMGRHSNNRRNINPDLHISHTIRLEDAFSGMDFTVNLPDGKKIESRIPQGIDDGMRIRLQGGGEFKHPGPPGDLFITIRVLPHDRFFRNGENLIVQESLDAIDAILGTTIDVMTLDNQCVRVSIPPGTQHGTRLRVANHGMPIMNSGNRRGALYVMVNIKIPSDLTAEQKVALEAFKSAK